MNRRSVAAVGLLLLCGAVTVVTAGGKSEPAAAAGGSPMVLKLMRGEHAAQAFKTGTPVLAEIEKRTGVRLQVSGVPSVDWSQKVKTMMATADIPDLLILDQTEAKSFFDSGIFLCVSDNYDKVPNVKRLVDANPQAKKMFSADGKMYTIPQFARVGLTLAQYPMIREDLMKKHGLKSPATFQELSDTLRQLKKLYPDSYPMSCRSGNVVQMFSYAMGSGNGIYFDQDKGNRWTYGPVMPEYKEMLVYLNGLFKDGVLDPDYLSNKQQQWQERMSTGRSFFSYDNHTFFPNFTKALQKQDPNAAFGPMQTFTTSKGMRRSWLYSKYWTSSYAISAKVKDRGAVLKFMNWLYGDEGADVTNFGVEGRDYTKSGNEITIAPALAQKHSADADPWRGYMSDIGAGLLAVAGYVDERTQFAYLSAREKAVVDTINQDPGMRSFMFTPVFNQTELDQLKNLQTKLDTTVGEAAHQFIMGEKPLADFDSWAASIIAAGKVQELEKIYNEAEARTK